MRNLGITPCIEKDAIQAGAVARDAKNTRSRPQKWGTPLGALGTEAAALTVEVRCVRKYTFLGCRDESSLEKWAHAVYHRRLPQSSSQYRDKFIHAI
jgi:hypothetical protein